MASWNDVRKIALALPETVEEEGFGQAQTRAWKVKDKSFAWERPLRKSDLAKLGAKAPKGAILAVRTADLEMKEAMLRSGSKAIFTIPHFDGYPAVLVLLAKIAVKDLRDLMIEGWLARAPKRVADEYLRTAER